MAAIDDLLNRIEDEELRTRIIKEVKGLQKNKKFGLVFEEHLPECTPLYDVPVKVGKTVALKNGSINDNYTVLDINADVAICIKKGADEQPVEIPVNDLVVVAIFGEPIYPYLKPIDSVCNAPDSNLWHTLIEADNYHALQLLDYLYHGKVDCIYIDPPYNSGAKDWKYNNDYVDGNDAYRHSKWLSFMEKRLKLAKKLLKPKDSVMIVTIDEKEYNHLGCLLEEIFPEAYIQMVTIVINPKGSTRGRFSRVEEYAYFCFMPETYIAGWKDAMLGEIADSDNKLQPRWKGLLRSGMDSRREDSPNQFYPILIDKSANRIIRAEESIPLEIIPDYEAKIDGYDVAWPIRSDGTAGRWMLSAETFNNMLAKGYISIGKYDRKRNTWGFSYLSKKYQQQIETGELEIIGYSDNGQSIIVEYKSMQDKQVKTVWHRTRHDAGAYGSDLVSSVIGRSRAFSYPKSLYSVLDSIGVIVGKKTNALIVDFFAGSGTTLHAVNLLNAVDGGHRRCIMVTNNEVSEEEANTLINSGFQPGDEAWEKLGIARYVTWPRIKCSIKGIDVNGNPLNGEYFTGNKKSVEHTRTVKQIAINASLLNTAARKSIVALFGKDNLPQSLVKSDSHYIIADEYSTSIIFDLEYIGEYVDKLSENDHVTDIYIVTNSNTVFKKIKKEINEILDPIIKSEEETLAMSNGFKENCVYFKLGFLDKTAVKIGRQFREILPMLWMKAGAVGVCPNLDSDNIPDMLILPENHFAVLIKESYFAEFKEKLEQYPEIDYVYIVTDYEDGYRAKINNLNVKNTFRLYSDYLDNFDINYRRN